jgi:hypothetical protein
MNRALALMLLLAATPAVSPLAQEVQKPEMAKMSLKVGDTAPDFILLSDQWKNVKLSDFRLRPGIYRRLNETTSGGPGWNRLG